MRFSIWAFLLAILLCVVPLSAQRTLIRLILKDGSYQVATKYEIQGERVHYFSAERAEWEDVPVAMVDWDATKKWQEEHSGRPQPVASPRSTMSPAQQEQEKAEEKAQQEKQDMVSPEIAPGERLPETGGVFIYDVYRDKPELIELQPNGGEVKQQTAKNILRATVNPRARPRASLELSGAHAKIQAHIPDPAIFVFLDTGGGPITPAMKAEAESRFRIVRVSVTNKAKRIVGVAKSAASGEISEKENFVPSKSEVLHNGQWLRFTATVPLVPGQYALVEMVGENQINIDSIFDFGVNSSAPDNRHVAPGQGNSTNGSGATPTPQK